MRRLSLALLALTLASFAGVAATPDAVRGASSSVTVVMDVASATAISPLGCSSAASTSFGTVLPDTPVVTSADCTVSFGSTNDTAALRMRQFDEVGTAMYRPPDGSFATAFGGTGKVTVPVGTGSDLARAMAVQANGDIVVVGTSAGASNDDFSLIRLHPNGTLDSTFGATTGKVVQPIGAGNDTGYAVAIQPADGRIIVAGSCAGSGNHCMARFKTDGTLDTTFNGTGYELSVVGDGSFQSIMAIALQPDGKIVTAGYAGYPGLSGEMVVTRVLPNGTIDSGFGTSGTVHIPGNANFDILRGVAIAPDGKIVATGRIENGARYDWATLRLNADGSLDTSFNGTGIKQHQVGSDDYARSVAVQPDGSIVTVGYANNGSNTDVAAVRYLVDGTLDPSFGVGGVAIAPGFGAADEGFAVRLLGDGRLYIGGFVTSGTKQMGVARLRANGTLDPTFGTGGAMATTIGSGVSEIGAIAIGADGSLYGAGQATNATLDFGVVRLGTVTVTDYAVGSADFTGGGSMFGACLRGVGAGASTDVSTWTPAGTCSAVSGPSWHAVASGTTGDKLAFTTVAGTSGATASLRFAARPALSQAPGTYIAPILFEVIAPG
ncbi:MAG: uncharacterized protein JWM98_697 [Thermoleophilia bacterium]|nr:uncharacterized protein [Thermoleophilia bacterium]